MNDDEYKQLLEQRRNEEACSLHFVPRIELLINSEHCKSLNDLLHQQNATWERARATVTLGTMLPDVPGLYMFVWIPELTLRFVDVPKNEQFTWVLYVGKAGAENSATATIKNRYLGEYSKYVGRDANCLWDGNDPQKREELLSRYLTLRPLWFWYLPMSNPTEIIRLEKKLIHVLRPPLNIQHGATLKSGKTQPVK